jgi:hypothetical protein
MSGCLAHRAGAPVVQCSLYIALLPLLGAAAQQNDEHLTVPAKIDLIARAAVDPQFRDALAERFRVGRIAFAKPIDGDRDPRGSPMIECIEPTPERADTLLGEKSSIPGFNDCTMAFRSTSRQRW